MKKVMTIFGSIGIATFILISCVGEKTKKTNTVTNTENASEETSKKVYRQGYSDGQTGYGLPAYERASANEFYMARGYNFSTADYPVYIMGYNDGVFGRSKQY